MSYNAASRGSCTSGEHLLWIYFQLILPCRQMGVESVKIDYSLLMMNEYIFKALAMCASPLLFTY